MGGSGRMANELEAFWRKLTFTEEEGEGIELGCESMKAAREIGKNCLVMKILTQRIIVLDTLRKHLKMLCKPNRGLWISTIEEEMFLVEFEDGRDKTNLGDVSLELQETTCTSTGFRG